MRHCNSQVNRDIHKVSHKNTIDFSFLPLVGSEIALKTAFTHDYIGKKQIFMTVHKYLTNIGICGYRKVNCLFNKLRRKKIHNLLPGTCRQQPAALLLAVSISLLLFACGSGGGAAEGNPGYEVPADPVYLASHPNPTSAYAATGINPGEIELHWQLPTEPAPTAIEIWRGKTPGQSFSIAADNTSSDGQLLMTTKQPAAMAESYLAQALTDNARYYFIIRLKYSDDLFSSGMVLQACTLNFENLRDVTITEIPGAGLRLDWQPPLGSGPAPSGFALYRSDVPFTTGGTEGLTPITSGTVSTQSFTDTPTDMTAGLTWYYLLVYTYSSYSEHQSSGTTCTHAITGTLIPPVSLDSARASNGKVRLQWTNPDSMSGRSIEIWRGPSVAAGFLDSDSTCIWSGSGEDSGELDTPADTAFYYAIYVRDSGANYSSPTRICRTSWTLRPVSDENINGDFGSATIRYSIPAGALRAEIYHASLWDLLSRKATGRTLRGASDNWTNNTFLHNRLSDASFEDGSQYYSVYAVYHDGVDWVYADRQNNMLGCRTWSADDYDLRISQTSSVAPDQIESRGGIPSTYNWDQYIFISHNTYRHPGALIRYTIDGSEPTAESPVYTVPFAIPADGTLYTVTAALFSSAGEKMSDAASADYRVQYEAYDNNFRLVVKNGTSVIDPEVSADSHLHSSAACVVYAEYKPVCGEIFSIYSATRTGTISTNEGLGLPSTVRTLFEAVTAAITADITTIHTQLCSDVHESTGTTSWQAATAQGTDSGGTMQRVAARLSIAGRPDSINNTLVAGANLKQADVIVINPLLTITELAMYNRPLMTPYLWTKQEPVVTMTVSETDFFSGNTTAISGIPVFFTVQYAAQNFPYGAASDTYGNPASYAIRWQGTLSDPSGSEITMARAGEGLQIIKTDPLPPALDPEIPADWDGKKWYSTPDGNWANYLQTIPSTTGRVYYQLDNPFDAAKMGEKAHTDTLETSGMLSTAAFRTVVRFRARAIANGFRTSNIVHSFESTTAATFDTTTRDTVSASGKPTVSGIPRFDAGTTVYTSDFADNFCSYPIEVCEHHEGWTSDNRLDRPWYEKHGIKYYGPGQSWNGMVNARNQRDDSRFKHFDPEQQKLVLYVHGWQPTASYEIPGYEPGSGFMNGKSNPTDLSSWLSTYGDPRVNYYDREWVADHWHAKGYNFAVFHWNRYSTVHGPQQLPA